MSDFLFSNKQVENGKLTKDIQAIYDKNPPFVQEYHGEWGSLATSRNIYRAFQPLETENHLVVVIGGPVLTFQSNDFLTIQENSTKGTKAIYDRWLEQSIKWDEDLDGPYVVLIIDKINGELLCVTDIMAYIPVFHYQNEEGCFLGTHIDALAVAAGQTDNPDLVSHVDFILHSVVTFPYTAYKGIFQLAPSSEHVVKEADLQSTPYWSPEEKNPYTSLKEAAKDIDKALTTYVDRITEGMDTIGQFISGGEDSRLLSALLPKKAKREAFIFLDNLNREGKVAEKAADAYGANLKLATRDKLHYLDILPACVNMVGNGAQYFHAHTFGFHESCHLNDFEAVFGGLFSDALLKGARIKKVRGTKRFPFLPQIKNTSYSAGAEIRKPEFNKEILEKLTKRRQLHLEKVKQFRDDSADEWFEMWPVSMNMNIPNLHVNRRLFRSYEPFMTNDIVKISAAVPQEWKLNRKLFHKASKRRLRPTKWLAHSDGRLPYFPWYINSVIQFCYFVYEKIGRKAGFVKGNQGPWGEWDVVMNSKEWQESVKKYATGADGLSEVFMSSDIKLLFEKSSLNYVQRINLLQTLYSFWRNKQ
ncbi:asparagine synthase-related protein [Ornithinibacillus sp. 179-J 7C1 HS]|uniref:asparagine synthase-related protein n=1 Tax=Ornithinibacillus sp. 179-J 7C1 HS TaxID=3142384 RepID=UPI0039A06024